MKKENCGGDGGKNNRIVVAVAVVKTTELRWLGKQ